MRHKFSALRGVPFNPLKHGSFRERVFRYLNYLRETQKRYGYKVVNKWEVAPHLIVACDEVKGVIEFDTYFDAEVWELSHSHIWDEDTIFPGILSGGTVGILPGVGTSTPPKDLMTATDFARQQLQKKEGVTVFHNEPRSI